MAPVYPVQQPAYTTEPITEITTIEQPVVTNSVEEAAVKKPSTTKKVLGTVLTALGAGALIGI